MTHMSINIHGEYNM